jgi:phosphoribosylglycinamide formyltransferase-1
MSTEDGIRLGFLASGQGSNLRAVVSACRAGKLRARPAVVISNNSRSGALEFARTESISWAHLSSQTHPEPAALDAAILSVLRDHSADLILLLGYMKKLGPRTLAAYAGRILNIHPALLPRHGGKGMYGIRVHEAVLAAGDAETGVTIHLVDGEYDSGPVLSQTRVPVEPGDTPQTLAGRVLEREHAFLVETLQEVVAGQIELPGLRARRATLEPRS